MASRRKQRIEVAVRVRPFLPQEVASTGTGSDETAVIDDARRAIAISTPHATRRFTFDHVLRPQCTQAQVYEATLQSKIDHFLNGFNLTILGYGQTASGKTYTIGSSASGMHNPAAWGLLPRVLRDVFAKIDADAVVAHVTFLEIYGEDIHDLLSPSPFLPNGARRVLTLRGIDTIDGAREVAVATPEEAIAQLSNGCAGRITGSTEMNHASSRSHAVFSLVLKTKADPQSIISKLTFVDLAGSERLDKTMADGQRMKEGIQINGGLLMLGIVINALACKTTYVPYRSSKLTRLLQHALGGNSRTLFIACVSPAASNAAETLNTLAYASRARNIQNEAVKNVDPLAAKMAQLQAYIASLERELHNALYGAPEALDTAAHIHAMRSNAEYQRFLERLRAAAITPIDSVEMVPSVPKEPEPDPETYADERCSTVATTDDGTDDDDDDIDDGNVRSTLSRIEDGIRLASSALERLSLHCETEPAKESANALLSEFTFALGQCVHVQNVMAEKAIEAREDAAMLRAAQSQVTSLQQQLQEQRDQMTALLQHERDTSRILDDIKQQLAQNQPGALNVDFTSQQLQLTAAVKDFQGQLHTLLQRPLLQDDHIPLSEHVALMQCATATLEAQLESARCHVTSLTDALAAEKQGHADVTQHLKEAHEHEKLAIRNEHQHEYTRALSESNKASAERREAETAYEAQLAALQRYASQLEGELQDAVADNEAQLEAFERRASRFESELAQLREINQDQRTTQQRHVRELEAQRSQLYGANTAKQAQLTALRRRVSQLEAQCTQLQEADATNQVQLTASKRRTSQLETECKQLREVNQAQLTTLQHRASEFETERAQLREINQAQFTAVQHLGARHEAECTQLRRTDAAYKAQLTALESSVSQLEVTRSQLQYAHAAQQQRAYQLETELTQLRDTSQEELSTLKHSVSLLTTERAELRTALQHHTSELEAARAQLRDVDAASQAHLAALRYTIAQRETECTQLRDDLSLARCDVRALTEELNRNTQPTPNKYERLAMTLGIEIPEVDLAAACQHDVAALCAQNRPGFGATEGLWLVDAANSSTVAPFGRAAVAALPARSTVTARDVLRLGCSYAARGLPVATINAMLDRLTIYHEVETTRTLNVSAPANVQYLQLTVPALEHPAITRTQCVALVVECDSHDQGWATDASHLNGSYRRCHSWVELHVTAPNGAVVVPRRDACRNLRARSAFRRHLLHITDTGVLAHLVAPGTRVTVSLRAQLPGWLNEARFARLAIAYKVALCDDLMGP